MRTLTSLIFVLAALAPSLALAQTWSESFAEPETSSIAPAKSVLVVAPDEGADEAALALVDALRISGYELVMTDEALGDIAKLGDQDIIERSKKLPVAGIVIIRVYPGKDRGTAVTMFTNLRDGTVVSATTVEGEAPRVAGIDTPESAVPGESIELLHQKTRSLAGPVGEDISRSADAISESISAQLKRGKFQREKVVFGQDDWSFYKGAFETPLATDEFFDLIGRDDLAASYRSTSSARTTIFVTSGALAAISAGMLFVGIFPALDSGDVNTTWTIIGASAGALSIGGFVWGALLEPYPVAHDEALELGETYNRRLARELGVTIPTDPQTLRLPLVGGRF